MENGKFDLTVHKLIQNAEDAPKVLPQDVLSEATRFVLSTTRETMWYTPYRMDSAQFGKFYRRLICSAVVWGV